MTNPEHIRLFLQGSEVWNKWRDDNPQVIPDLRDAQLKGKGLREMHLNDAILTNADLSKANLTLVNLTQANLTKANLRNANLMGADIDGANLDGADLCGAKLYGASIMDANLVRTELDGAIFTECFIGGTVFGDVDLSQGIDLDKTYHSRPSTIGLDTIIRSQGSINVTFLQKAGIKEEVFRYIATKIGQASQYYTCFISYNKNDEQLAQRLYDDLHSHRVDCWLDRLDMLFGAPQRTTLKKEIAAHDRVLLIISESSIASRWVMFEVKTALEKEHELKDQTVIIPIRVDNAVMTSISGWPATILRRYIGDFCTWQDPQAYKQAFERLLEALTKGEK